MLNKFLTYFLLIFGIIISFQESICAQQTDSANLVRIIHADEILFERFGNREIQYLRKNILVQHRKTYLACDSAIIEGNNVVAIGNVKILESDSLQIFGDTLKYYGDINKSECIGKVLLKHHGKDLISDHLLYDMKTRIASYSKGAILATSRVRLKSKAGQYLAKKEIALFRDSVIVVDSTGLELFADSLRFLSKSEKVEFIGPTLIKQTEKEIYCESGFYDLKNETSLFEKNTRYKHKNQSADAEQILYHAKTDEMRLYTNAYIIDSSQTIRGDTIIYNQKTGWVNIFGHAHYADKERILTGDRIDYNKNTKSVQVYGKPNITEGSQIIVADNLTYDGVNDIGKASGNVMYTDTVQGFSMVSKDVFTYNKKEGKMEAGGNARPYIAIYLENDTLYIASDSMYSEMVKTEEDSFRVFQSFNDVRIFSKKYQGLCDSLYFNGKDSTFTLFTNPILWSDTSQFDADTIVIKLEAKALRNIFLRQNALIVNQASLGLYNQLKGRTIITHFLNKEIDEMLIYGNAESLYFITDKDEAYIGVNYSYCSDMRIRFLESKIQRIYFYTQPKGNMLPLAEGKDKKLDGFHWELTTRPENLESILID